MKGRNGRSGERGSGSHGNVYFLMKFCWESKGREAKKKVVAGTKDRATAIFDVVDDTEEGISKGGDIEAVMEADPDAVAGNEI